jgi:cobalt/nickel transport system permease protein
MEYCLSLVGPLGVLVGGAAGFQVVFIVSVILALLGQGGLTVVGLNALVMGAGAAVARPVYVRLVGRAGAAWGLAWATACAQLVSGVLWFAVLAIALRLSPALELGGGDHDHGAIGGRHALFAGVTLALWGVAVFAEAAVAFGIGRFLGRVRPDLLPAAAGPPGPAQGARE